MYDEAIKIDPNDSKFYNKKGSNHQYIYINR